MTLRRAVAPAGIDGGDDRVALDEFAGLDVDAVRPQRFGDLLHIGDGCPGCPRRARARDAALVGDLTTRLRVERGAVEDELDAVGLPGRRGGRAAKTTAVVGDDGYPLAVDENAENPCLGSQFIEAGEL